MELLMGLDEWEIEELQKLSRRNRRACVIWAESYYDLYPHPASGGTAFHVGNRDWNGFSSGNGIIHSLYRSGGESRLAKEERAVFVDFLDKFGERFPVGSYPSIAWWISVKILITALRTLEEDPEQLEELTRAAKTKKDFMALAAIV